MLTKAKHAMQQSWPNVVKSRHHAVAMQRVRSEMGRKAVKACYGYAHWPEMKPVYLDEITTAIIGKFMVGELI